VDPFGEWSCLLLQCSEYRWGGVIAAREDVIEEAVERKSVRVRIRRGLNFNRTPDLMVPETMVVYSVTMEEMGRVEAAPRAVSARQSASASRDASLPTGYAEGRCLHWKPGSGFLGE
jgi:hypothetical protein